VRPWAIGCDAPRVPAMHDGPIGVFDSGVGGLTVLRALIDVLPDEGTIYFGDTGRFPYGPKPQEDVLKYALEITDVLLERGVKALVVACNSATAAALEALDERLEIPVIGVIDPGMRAALAVTQTGRIGVIGTVGTIASGAYQREALRLSTASGPGTGAAEKPDVTLTYAACPGFVEFVEAGDVDSDQVHVLAERLLAPLVVAHVDTLILGCTHYPLLARTIGDVMGRDVVLVSSADETAFAVRELLIQREMRAVPHAGPKQHLFLTSGPVDTFRTLGARFLGPEVVTIEPWRWS
jgi:glutamate racemase